MTYKDPKMGVIDLSSEELPKVQKAYQLILKICACIYGGIGLFALISLLFVDILLAVVCAALCGIVAWLCLFAAKKFRAKYYKARNSILAKAKCGEIDLFDEDKFFGVIINNTEVGTNLLGWVRGIDQTSSLTPVSARFTFTNKTGKEIKYITFGVRPYNAVDDPVECTVTGISLYNCTCTGPFAPNGKYTQTLEHAWYNTSIASAKIESVQIIYMDNSTQILTSDEIKCLAKDVILNDNDSRIVRKGFGQILMIIAGIIDVISIIGIFTMSSEVFGVLTAISTIAFFVGLMMKPN